MNDTYFNYLMASKNNSVSSEQTKDRTNRKILKKDERQYELIEENVDWIVRGKINVYFFNESYKFQKHLLD